MGIYGQDWASYQSSTPDTTGLSFAFVKITEGLSYINPKWVSQRDHAKAHGLVWGAYHYPHMANAPREEADYFLTQAAWKPGDVIVLDWEGYDPANRDVPRRTQAAYKEEWLRYVKRRMPYNPVGMYANLDYWRNVDTTSYYADFLWIATAGRVAGDPGIQANWLFHQYSESGGVDRDYCHLSSRTALRDWALSFQPTPPTPPAPAARYTEDDMLAYLPPIPANQAIDVPVEPAGTLTSPQGGARNGPLWLVLAAQATDAQVTITFHHEGGTWDAPAEPVPVTVAGSKYVLALPASANVDKVRIRSTAPLAGYLTGRQVA
ncbi:glycoside hydrolase family 25 protein [Streptomyces sp. SCA3-4]|uniref:glycoside hydrolase family 25 protein n=1 Tax=Streptomyces sichuanensis TaxID=2871810 RepID=UPI001CE2E9EB|nr:glycoside hydrolase family 25 protein [Streptomyces sichuanensis]MCA6091403.1 glycoside hydrolase family 25 protein [Streptomyces sichuanensis]